jgi:hypothetical protein
MMIVFIIIFLLALIIVLSGEFSSLIVFGPLKNKNLEVFEAMQVNDISLNRFDNNIFHYKNYTISTDLSLLSKYHVWESHSRIPKWSKAHFGIRE